MPIPGWTIGLIFKGVGALWKNRRNKRRARREWDAIKKEVPQMDGLMKVLWYVFQMRFLAGYRTKIAGVGSVLTGLGALIQAVTGGEPFVDAAAAWAMILGGLAAIGLRDK